MERNEFQNIKGKVQLIFKTDLQHFQQQIYHPDKRINKEIADSNIMDEMNLTDIYRTFYPTTAEYTFFSSTHGIFSKIDHMSGHKTSLNKFKKTEIIPSIFSGHNGMKPEINNKGKTGKFTNT